MTARSFFEHLGPLLVPAVQEIFNRRDLCILSTRVALDVASYYGIDASAVPVQACLYNAAFARHVACDFSDVADRYNVASWGDGSWSVGIGYGAPRQEGRWDGHLIIVSISGECFADYSIGQAERLQHDIVTGDFLVGPYSGQELWQAVNDTGTVVEYRLTQDDGWRTAPDWKDAKRRRPIVGKLIRALREVEVMQA